MFRRYVLIVGGLVFAVIGAYLYFHFRVPEGISVKGDTAETVAWIGLATAIVSALTSLTQLVQVIVSYRAEIK